MPDPNAPLVSVVTPSYNQGEFIADTIESVLGQDYPNIEYLVIDGGSTDSTIGILERYGGRIQWTSERDAGQSDAIRRGFAQSRGDIIAWINADDVYAPMAISRAVAALLAQPDAGLVYGRAQLVDRAGHVTEEQAHVAWSFDTLLNRGNYIPQAASFFRRPAYESVGGISADLHFVMDYDLWLKIGRRFPVVDIDHVLARVRMYPETKTASGGLQRIDEMRRMIGAHGRAELPEWHQWDAFRAFVQAARQTARAGRWTAAIKLASRGTIIIARRPFVARGVFRFVGRRARQVVRTAWIRVVGARL